MLGGHEMKAKPLIEPHLVIKDAKLPKGGEWVPQFRGWSFLQVNEGISYWQQQNGSREIAAGSVLVLRSDFRRRCCGRAS